jgi:capsular polysaccharide biosynthesis protein
MTEIQLYLAIIRRRWWLLVALALLTALLTLALALAQPLRYGLTVRLLVTRTDLLAHPPAESNVDTEDRVAYDLPAIISSAAFARDVVRALAEQGHPLSESEVEQALHADNDRQLVRLSVTTPKPDDAVVIAQTAVSLIQTNGLRYWGVAQTTPAAPGLNVAVLDPPTQAGALNNPTLIAREVALRGLLGLFAGIGLAFALHYFDEHSRAPSLPARPVSSEEYTSAK